MNMKLMLGLLGYLVRLGFSAATSYWSYFVLLGCALWCMPSFAQPDASQQTRASNGVSGEASSLTKPIEKQALRLVSTSAGLTQTIHELGLSSALVGIDVTSELPSALQQKYEIKNLGYHRNLSAEGLLSLNPNWVIGTQQMGPERVINNLRKADVNILMLPTPYSTSTLVSNTQKLAHTFERETIGAELVQRLKAKLVRLEPSPLAAKKLAFVLNMDAETLNLAGQGTAGATFLALLGGYNVAEHPNYQKVSAEALLAMQPDAVILVGSDQTRAIADLFAAKPVLKHAYEATHIDFYAIDGSGLVAGLSERAIDQALALVEAIEMPASSQ